MVALVREKPRMHKLGSVQPRSIPRCGSRPSVTKTTAPTARVPKTIQGTGRSSSIVAIV